MNDSIIFDPNKWHTCIDHDFKICSKGVNCYSYLLNNPNYYWSVPGFGFAHTKAQQYFDSFNDYFKNITIENFNKSIIDGAIKDGLIKIDEPEDRIGYYQGALFFSNSQKDFHWYRKDGDGGWSSKDGWREVKKENITDPSEITNSLYPTFGGYFLIPRIGVFLEPTFPLLEK